MSLREEMEPWIVDALKRLKGEASIAQIAEDVWTHHEGEIRSSHKGLFTWQYEMRWSGQDLQKQGLLKKSRKSWRLI